MSELRKPYRPGNEEEIPAGLEYRPEMWDSALGLIENHEKVVFRRKLLMAAGVLLVLALGTGIWDRNMSSDGAQMAHQQDVFYAELRNAQDGQFELSSGSSDQEETAVTAVQANMVGTSTIESVESIVGGIAAHEDIIPEDTELAVAASVTMSPSQEEAQRASEGNEITGTTEVAVAEDNALPETPIDSEANTQETQVVQEIVNIEIPADAVQSARNTEGDASNAEVAENSAQQEADEAIAQDAADATNTNLHEGIQSADATIGGEAENPIPLNIKQINEGDSPLLYEPFAEGAPAPHEFSTEFMGLGQELAQMDPRPYALIANSTDFKKPQGVIVNLKTKELLLPLQQFNVQVMLGTSILTHYGSRERELALSPAAGVGIDYNFKRRLSVNAQLEYFSVKNIQRDRVVVQEEIDFALRTTTFTYNTEKLHYLSLPVNLAIRLKSRHQLSFGGGLSYMLAANNLVKVEEESTANQANVSDFEVNNVADGFAPVNTYLNFGYNYYVTPNVTLGLRYQAGLTDVTLDNSGLFSTNRKDRNTRLAAYVRFNVF